jgi:hypothetical protein
MEIEMANSRRDDKSNHARDTVRQIGESTAERTRRIGETAAETGQNAAQIGAALMQQNTEMLQNALRFGPDLATTVMERSAEQLSRAFGLSNDDVQQAAERSSRNAATILHSSSAVAQSMSGISREYFAFVRQQIESGMNRMNDLWRCRTPQDVAAVQAEFLRETVEGALQSGRRVADMSLKVVDDAGSQMTKEAESRAA